MAYQFGVVFDKLEIIGRNFCLSSLARFQDSAAILINYQAHVELVADSSKVAKGLGINQEIHFYPWYFHMYLPCLSQCQEDFLLYHIKFWIRIC